MLVLFVISKSVLNRVSTNIYKCVLLVLIMAEFSDTPLMEITLRRYESPRGLSKRDTLRKICLSLGLLQPGDSRDVIVDILLVLENIKHLKKELSSIEIKEEVVGIRSQAGLSSQGTADSNIRRQLKRLRDVHLVEKVRNNYRIVEFSSLRELFENRIQKILLQSIVQRNVEYFDFYSQFEHDSVNNKNNSNNS